MPGLDELAVEVPDGGIGDHAVCHDFRTVREPDAVGLSVLDQDFVHHVAVEHLSAVSLDRLLQLVREHLG